MSQIPVPDQEAMRLELEAVQADIDANPWPTDVAAARILYDQMGPPIASDIRAERRTVGGVPAQILTPPAVDEGRAVLFLHGGGYVYGSLASHGGMAAELARASRCKCVQLDYRRAPEHPFPAALEDACAAYEAMLLDGTSPARIVIIGDSAGGGLVMSTLLALKEKARPMPGAAVCLSPWVDLQSTGESFRTRQALDPMIDREICLSLAAQYLGAVDPRSPLVSPIHADLRGLPPLLIQVGEREVLFSEAETLAARARDAGVAVIFEEWLQMVHVWHLYYPILTAGREAIARVGAFVQEKTS